MQKRDLLRHNTSYVCTLSVIQSQILAHFWYRGLQHIYIRDGRLWAFEPIFPTKSEWEYPAHQGN